MRPRFIVRLLVEQHRDCVSAAVINREGDALNEVVGSNMRDVMEKLADYLSEKHQVAEWLRR